MQETEIIKKGKEIKEKVESLKVIAFDSYNYSGKECDNAKEEIKKLWEQCEGHEYEWLDTNPYSETCICKHCGADSPRTRSF